MDKFTVKDFIVHNNPCFSCGEHIFIKIGVSNSADSKSYLRPNIDANVIDVVLKENYSNTLKLQILTKSNKIVCSNEQRLVNYLFDHKLWLHSQCNKCLTTISSEYLDFNVKRGFVKPVKLHYENLQIIDHEFKYQIVSSFECKRSTVSIGNINPIIMELPLLSLSKFRNRDKLLSKLKTYAIFS